MKDMFGNEVIDPSNSHILQPRCSNCGTACPVCNPPQVIEPHINPVMSGGRSDGTMTVKDRFGCHSNPCPNHGDTSRLLPKNTLS